MGSGKLSMYVINISFQHNEWFIRTRFSIIITAFSGADPEIPGRGG